MLRHGHYPSMTTDLGISRVWISNDARIAGLPGERVVGGGLVEGTYKSKRDEYSSYSFTGSLILLWTQ
jgi:hypothetical protein